MTAKHRKGKSNHKQEDNFFKSEAAEPEVRPGGSNFPHLLVFVLIVVAGGAAGAWFCVQQHQTLTYLTDSLMGAQMKIVKLQASHEDLRLTNSKQHISESLETRLSALEESYALAKKQVGVALATAEQLKTSDFPAQVLSLHTEMKTRLAEVQQASVSTEQLSRMQSAQEEKSEEFEDVRIQVEGLAALTGELSQKVEGLTLNLAEAESKLEESAGEIVTLSAALIEQATEVLKLQAQLEAHQAQLEDGILETAELRELLESEQSLRLQQVNAKEQLVEEMQPPDEPIKQTKEEDAAATEEEETSETTEGEDAAAATEGDYAAGAAEEEDALDTEEEDAAAATEEEDASTEEEEAAAATEGEDAAEEKDADAAAAAKEEEAAEDTVEEVLAAATVEEEAEASEEEEAEVIATTEEELAAALDEEEEQNAAIIEEQPLSSVEEAEEGEHDHRDTISQDESPAEQEDSETEETAPEAEGGTAQGESGGASEKPVILSPAEEEAESLGEENKEANEEQADDSTVEGSWEAADYHNETGEKKKDKTDGVIESDEEEWDSAAEEKPLEAEGEKFI